MTRHTHERNQKRSLAAAKPAALSVLLTVAAAWLWAHEGHQALPVSGVLVDAAKGSIVLAPEPRTALDVRTAEVTEEVLEGSLSAPATLEAPWQRHAFASAGTGGKVVAFHVGPGQSVSSGQLLAEVESLDLESLLLEFLTDRNAAWLSGANLRALEAAYLNGSVSDRSLRDYRAQHRADDNALEVARRKLLILGVEPAEVARLQREDNPAPLRTLPVRSPVAGVVLHVDARVGQIVQPSDHIAEVVDTSVVWVRVGVLEKDLRLVHVGQPVEVRLAAYPARGQVFRTTVHVKGRALDPKTHQAAVWAELANIPGRPPVFPGMVGEARLVLPRNGRSLTVPDDALVRDGAEAYVLVETGPGQYVRRNVIPGRSARGLVEVRSPQLYPGDRVVTVGDHELGALFVRGTFRISPEAAESARLMVEPVRRQPLENVVDLSGAVELAPERRSVVASRLPGIVYRIQVDRDQAVQAGDVVAEVASAEFQNLQLDLLRNHLEVTLLEEALTSLRPVAERGALPERQIRETEAAAAAARQRRDSARRKLKAVGLSAQAVQRLVEKGEFGPALPVRAPIAGSVVRFRGVLGQSVKAEEPLFEVHDPAGAAVRAYVPERLVSAVGAGQHGRVRFLAEPDYLAEVIVTRSDRAVESDSRVLSLWADLGKESKTPLLEGMLARVSLVVGAPISALAVPKDAVLWEGTQSYLFVRGENDTFERRAVNTGRSDDRFVEIATGLREGEMVAVRGVAELQNAYATVK